MHAGPVPIPLPSGTKGHGVRALWAFYHISDRDETQSVHDIQMAATQPGSV